MSVDERSDLIAFDGMRYAPENELGVVLLFGKMHKDLGFPELDVIQPQFPDCWAFQKTQAGTRRVWIEFEYRSRSFKPHVRQLRHLRPKKGIVVCWENDWPEVRRYAEVIELKTEVGFGKRVWLQCTGPRYQNELDEVYRRRKGDWTWTVSGRARPGDLVLMYRSGTKSEARRYDADETLLQSIANVYEVTSYPKWNKKWKWEANVRQIADVEEPLRLEHLRDDPILRRAGWVRAQFRGRPEVTAHWWRLRQLILQMNKSLQRNKQFLTASGQQV